MIRFLASFVLAMMSAGLLNGCSYSYDVEMGVKKDGVQTSVSTSAPLLPVEQEHLEKVFGKPTRSKKSNVLTFPAKLMSGTWDNGFGGTGAVRHYESPLGNAVVYMDAMGGNMPLYKDQQLLHECLDLALDMVASRVRSKAKDKALAEKLAKLVETKLRADLHDVLSVTLGILMATSLFDEVMSDSALQSHRKKFEQDSLSAFVSLMYQRGWFSIDQACLVHTEADVLNDREILAKSLLNVIDMPYTQKNTTALISLGDECFNEEFGDKLREAMQKKCAAQPHLQVLVNNGSKFLTSYSFNQQMQTGPQGVPAATNGSFDSTTDTISWSVKVSPWCIGLLSVPVSNSSIWVTVDDAQKAAQKKLFKKPLSDNEVATFCVAWSGASKQNQDAAMKRITKQKAIGGALADLLAPPMAKAD
ncbi:MAG: hypothetical protein VX527_01365 [Planctomycetota bacterium]|nr:hypothetical protein [Planctomycetota bacterium]